MPSPRQLLDVSLSALRPNPDQPRKTFDDASLEELAQSIRQHGVIQPIAIKRDPERVKRYMVVAGERRVRASRLVGRESIPAILVMGKEDELALIENLQRENLNPIEEAEALHNLMQRHGYTHADLAQVVGKGRSTVTNLLGLNALPEEIKRECSTSNINRSLLIEISKVKSRREQLSLWDKAQAGGTVRSLRERKATRRRSPGRPRDGRTLAAAALASGRSFAEKLDLIVADESPISDQEYEQLLELYQRFLAFFEKQVGR